MRRFRKAFLVVFVLLWISLQAFSVPRTLWAEPANQAQSKEAVVAQRISGTDADVQSDVAVEKKEVTAQKGPASDSRQVRFLGFIWFLGSLK